jgi:predicted SAM-dependent methyltransferase
MFEKLIARLRPAPRKETRQERRQREWGGDARYCPVCEKSAGRFAEFGARKRADARCPWCDALERHRFAWLYLTTKSDLFGPPPKTLLHFAPEPGLAPLLRKRLGGSYLTADLLDPKADLQTDIMNIRLPDAKFDVAMCSHVLEHIVDDRKAMRGLHRVLKPGGWALISVPIMAETTFEDPAVVDPAERERVFGHPEHVRIYGKDFKDRLIEAGFAIETIYPRDLYTLEERKRMGLGKASGEIFIGRKDP